MSLQVFPFNFHMQSVPNILISVLVFFPLQRSFTKDILHTALSWRLWSYCFSSSTLPVLPNRSKFVYLALVSEPSLACLVCISEIKLLLNMCVVDTTWKGFLARNFPDGHEHAALLVQVIDSTSGYK